MKGKDIRKGDIVEVRYIGEVYWKNGEYACMRSGNRDLPPMPYDLVHRVVSPEELKDEKIENVEGVALPDVNARVAALESTISLLDEQISLLKRLLQVTANTSDSQNRTLRNLHDRLYNLEEWQQYMFPDGGRQ